MNDCRHGAIESYCPSCRLSELEVENAKLKAEVKLQSDSADHWEDEAMNHMSQAAKLQAVVDAAKHLVSKYGDELMHRCDVDALEQALKEVES